MSFAGNLHNMVCFCQIIETRGRNPMFQLEIHLLLNILVLLETFTTGLIFARQVKQGATMLCFDQNYISVVSQNEPCCEGCTIKNWSKYL